MTYAPDLIPAHEARHGRTWASAETWEAARRDYFDGWSAPEVCARHDLKIGTFRHRAKQEGWRRADQPIPGDVWIEDEPTPLPRTLHDDDYLKDYAGVDSRAMAEIARRNLAQALFKGQSVEAARWLRLAQSLEADHSERECRKSEREIIGQFMQLDPEPGPALPPPTPQPDAAASDVSDLSDPSAKRGPPGSHPAAAAPCGGEHRRSGSDLSDVSDPSSSSLKSLRPTAPKARQAAAGPVQATP